MLKNLGYAHYIKITRYIYKYYYVFQNKMLAFL